MSHAFRCKNCGFLHHAEHAGVNQLPHACRVCGAGVKFHPQTGLKSTVPENWEVLADCTPERHKELGLEAAPVKHTPDHTKDHAHNLKRCQEALAILDDKEKLWASKPVGEWQKQLDALHAQYKVLEDQYVDPNDSDGYAKVEAGKAKVRGQIVDLLACEWTNRDDAHRAKLKEAIANEGRPLATGMGPKSVRVFGKSGIGIKDKIG